MSFCCCMDDDDDDNNNDVSALRLRCAAAACIQNDSLSWCVQHYQKRIHKQYFNLLLFEIVTKQKIANKSLVGFVCALSYREFCSQKARWVVIIWTRQSIHTRLIKHQLYFLGRPRHHRWWQVVCRLPFFQSIFRKGNSDETTMARGGTLPASRRRINCTSLKFIKREFVVFSCFCNTDWFLIGYCGGKYCQHM